MGQRVCLTGSPEASGGVKWRAQRPVRELRGLIGSPETPRGMGGLFNWEPGGGPQLGGNLTGSLEARRAFNGALGRLWGGR